MEAIGNFIIIKELKEKSSKTSGGLEIEKVIDTKRVLLYLLGQMLLEMIRALSTTV